MPYMQLPVMRITVVSMLLQPLNQVRFTAEPVWDGLDPDQTLIPLTYLSVLPKHFAEIL